MRRRRKLPSESVGESCYLRNARLPDGRRVDVTVADGVVASVIDVEPAAPSPSCSPGSLAGEAGDPAEVSAGIPSCGAGPGSLAGGAGDPADRLRCYDLGGMLLLPALVEPHAHLDKALLADRIVNQTGDLEGAIEAWVQYRSDIEPGDAFDRASRAVEIAMANGVTAMRTHVDVGGDIGIRNVEALCALRSRYERCVDLQLVALAHSPLTGAEGRKNRLALAQAMEAGADLVGGCPAIDPRPSDCVKVCLDAAVDAEAGVDLHVDETLDAEVCTLVDLARAVIDRGFPHPVTASHCVSLGMMDASEQRSAACLVAAAGIGVVTLPQTNLFLQGRGVSTATPRGLTALQALADAGVQLAGGGDNLQDPFNLMGRGDPFEIASLLVTAGHLKPETAFEYVSTGARTQMGLRASGVYLGAAADFVAVKAASVREALASAQGSRFTWKAGSLTAQASWNFSLPGVEGAAESQAMATGGR